MWNWILVYAIIVFLGFGIVKHYIIYFMLIRRNLVSWEKYGVKDELITLLIALTIAGTISLVMGMYVFMEVKPGFCLKTPKELKKLKNPKESS